METVQWEQINNDQFSVFIRDLSSSLNTNLKSQESCMMFYGHVMAILVFFFEYFFNSVKK